MKIISKVLRCKIDNLDYLIKKFPEFLFESANFLVNKRLIIKTEKHPVHPNLHLILFD